MNTATLVRAAAISAACGLNLSVLAALAPGTAGASPGPSITPSPTVCSRQLIGTVSSPQYLEASAPSAGTYLIEYDITGTAAFFDTYVNGTELGYVGGPAGTYRTRTFPLTAGGVLAQVAGPEGAGQANVYLDQAC